MQFKAGASVYTSDDHRLGEVERVVINPKTKMVTHLVIQKGFLFGEDKLMPVDLVASTEEDRIQLSKTKEEIGELPPYEIVHYVDVNETELPDASFRSDYARPVYFYPKYRVAPLDRPAYPVPEYQIEIQRTSTDARIALQAGAAVTSSDGKHVGDVERVFAKGDSDEVTHILISEGLLFKEKKLIPAHWIDKIEDESVSLTVGSGMLDDLPEYQED